MNKVVLVGRLTKDPELRYTQSNIAAATFTLAVNRNYKNANGGYDADFIPVVVWRGLAEMLSKRLKKGSRVCISGRIQTSSYDGNDGQKRYVTEVLAEDATIIDWDGPQGGSGNAGAGNGFANDMNVPPAGFTSIDDIDDEVPF